MKHVLHSWAAAHVARWALAAVAVAALAACGGGDVADDLGSSTAAPSAAIAAAKARSGSAATETTPSTIVTVALAVNGETGLFDTLLTAATCDSLGGAIVDALSRQGQRTLFAPTDDAFAALGLTPANVCSALPAPVLANVLSYHVANGRRDAAAVLDATQLRMLNGERVQQSDAVLTDGLGRTANIVVTDVAAGNGIIHAIDSVLLPPGFGS